MAQLTGFTGLCSTIGGAAWTAACLIHNSLPQGCIGETCAVRPMRGSSSAADLLFAVAVVMLVGTGVGLLSLVRTASSRLGALSVLGAIAGGLGLALLLAAAIVGSIIEDFAGMPALVVPGGVLVVFGLALFAGAVLRAGVLPTWLSLLLLGTALLLLAANEQTSRILFAVPFGLAWLATGVLLLRRSRAVVHGVPAT